ncbi:MAG: hypothetical protein L6416_07415 [Candidatus Omnitrophica bacterium]|nr:hypothetical protein [Candidatus Omnitrophota bacterium]
MRAKKVSIFIGLLVCLFFLPCSLLRAQSYREEAAISSVYIYQQMINQLDEGNLNKVLQLSHNLDEIISKMDMRFGASLQSDIQNAVNAADKEKARKAVIALIFYDIKDVFYATEEGISEQLALDILKERLKIAYLDYLVVSSQAKKLDFERDRQIRKAFSDLLTGHLAKAVLQSDMSMLKKGMANIDENYKEIFGIL